MIGGDQRTLEYLDALLRDGNAQIASLGRRLQEFVRKTGVSLASEAPFEERVADAIRVAAAAHSLTNSYRL